MVMGQGREGGGKEFFKQWYCLHSPPGVEFTFNYQMIPHYPQDSVLHTLNIYGLQIKVLPHISYLVIIILWLKIKISY